MKTIIFLLIIVALLWLLVATLLTKRRLHTGVQLAASTKAFQREVVSAWVKILMIGDSTVVGVGARVPEESLAGQVGASFPQASITNKGVNGAKTKELISRLEDVTKGQFDLIMVHIGGNDVVRFTNLNELVTSIAEVLKLASSKAKHVTLVMSGNVGTAPLLPYGTRWVFEQRTRKVRNIFMEAARQHNVQYIDLFREHDADPFYANPTYYYAADLFHPSSAGYADWYKIIYPVLKSLI